MTQNADLIIKNAKIWSDKSQSYALENASIVIGGGRILEIGNTPELVARHPMVKTWDAAGKLITPGFINTHCHLFQTFIRGLGKDMTFIEWMNRSVRLMMPNMDSESIYLAAMVGCLEAIRTGTTTLVDFMYATAKPNHCDEVLRAFDDCGLRGVLARGLTDVEFLPGSTVPASTSAPVEVSFRDHDRLRNLYQAHPRISFILAPSVIWGMTWEGLTSVSQYAKANDSVVTMHLLETLDDDQFSMRNYGLRTTRVLEETGILDTHFMAVHAIQLEEEDFDLFVQYKTSISHNPVANMILGSGVSPICKFVERGIPVSLGTDGAASNDSQSLLEVMKSAALLQKVHYRDTALLSARDVFSMATIQGAKAVGMDDQIGSIEVGKRADLLVIDFEQPNTTPCYNPIASLVYSGNHANIHSVFVEGNLILEDGHFATINEADILKQAQAKAEEIYQFAVSH
ncbi:MAG: amidohydrolase family protein [Anaerolineaceae bacterium]